MSEHSTLIAGKVDDWEDIIKLFEERDVEYSDTDEYFDTPHCLAGELLGFGYFDHDRCDYVESSKALNIDPFFEEEDVLRISDWSIDKEAVKQACKEQGLQEISFIHRFGDEHFKQLEPGKQVKYKNGFVHFLGYFDGNAIKTIKN